MDRLLYYSPVVESLQKNGSNAIAPFQSNQARRHGFQVLLLIMTEVQLPDL